MTPCGVDPADHAEPSHPLPSLTPIENQILLYPNLEMLLAKSD